MTEITFWHYVNKDGPFGCWLWLGAIAGSYGRALFRGRLRQAHHISLTLEGRDPGNKQVCHICDVRLCVNPAHLVIADQKWNMQDMIAKGRARFQSGKPYRKGYKLVGTNHRRGANHPSHLHPELRPRGEDHYLRKHPELIRRGADNYNSKLTEAQVLELRSTFANGKYNSYAAAAIDFSITARMVSLIVRRKNWVHI